MNPPQVSSSLQKDLIAQISSLRAFAVTLCRNRDQADDLVQETLLKAWRNLDKYEEGTNLKAWLFTILRNTFFTARQKAKREVQDSDGSFTESLTEPARQNPHMDFQDFRSALNTLPEDQSEALVLVGAAGFSYKEAADICDCPVGTLKSRVNRARARLAEILDIDSGGDGGDDGLLDAAGDEETGDDADDDADIDPAAGSDGPAKPGGGGETPDTGSAHSGHSS